MFRFLGPALCATLLLSACKIERTPREYYTQREPAETERALFEEEIRDRVGALGQSLTRGDVEAAVLSLSPASDAYLLGPAGGTPGVGLEGAARALGELTEGEPAEGEPPELEVVDVRVTLGPRAQVAWFAALLEVRSPGEPEAGLLRFTGVYLRQRGAWQLVQAHLSRPVMSPAAPPPYPAPDSLPREGA